MEQNVQLSETRIEDTPEYVPGLLGNQQPPPPYQSLPNLRSTGEEVHAQFQSKAEGLQEVDFSHAFKGYENGMRKLLEVHSENQPKISLWSILKSMASGNFKTLSLPASFNKPTSQLQRCAEDLEYADLLDIAAEQKDSAWRMVYVAAFAYSETYEYARPDKNYRFLAEQVSHHPPHSAVWAESSNWTFYGEAAKKSTLYSKSFDMNSSGTWFLKLRLASGFTELYTWKKPVVSISLGVIAGSPTIDNHGPMEIKNWTTGDICVIGSLRVSLESEFSGSVKDTFGQTRFNLGGRLNSKIYAQVIPDHELPLENSKYQGTHRNDHSNSSQISTVWEANQLTSRTPFNLTSFLITMNDIPDELRVYLPPTDTRFRPDQRAVEQNQYDLAAAEKTRLEEKQREKRREQEAASEKFVPRWFRRVRCDITGEDYWDFNGSYWKERASMDGEKWKGVEDIFGNPVAAKAFHDNLLPNGLSIRN